MRFIIIIPLLPQFSLGVPTFSLRTPGRRPYPYDPGPCGLKRKVWLVLPVRRVVRTPPVWMWVGR